MKIEDLEQEQKKEIHKAAVRTAVHKEGNGTSLSIIDRGIQYIYLADPVSGEVERRVMGPAGWGRRAGIHHGMGAVRD